jgi:hypothetical protein
MEGKQGTEVGEREMGKVRQECWGATAVGITRPLRWESGCVYGLWAAKGSRGVATRPTEGLYQCRGGAEVGVATAMTTR